MRRLLPLLFLLIAGCQPLPHPFADDVPPPRSPILRPRDSLGIVVAPVAGLPAPLAEAAADAMAGALCKADIPASTTGGNRGSYRLAGTAHAERLAQGRTRLAIEWALRAADARLVGRVPAAAEISGTEDAAAVRALAGRAAPAIAKLVQDEPPTMAAVAQPIVAVRPVTGVPGKDGETLTRAMGEALRRAHVALAAGAGDKQDLVLTGQVRISPPAAGRQQIAVSWTLSSPDGHQIGQINQQNALPAGSVEGDWGDIAYAIASAAAPGVAALIDKAKTSGGL